MIERKLKICFGCSKPRVIWKRHEGKGYCKDCWSALKTGVATSSLKPTEQYTNKSLIRTPIPSRSPKRIKQDAVYKVLREQFLKDHPMCMIAIKGICTGRSNQIHHSHSGKDREEYYLDTTTWYATDHNCHEWVHDHPIEAKELGFLK